MTSLKLQYYQEVLGTRQLNLFEARFGLLLQGEIHHAFDRGHIALYPLVSDTLDGSRLLSTISTLTSMISLIR